MRRIDAGALKTFGIEPLQLMEVAGTQVARFVDDWLAGAAGTSIGVIAGAGNNGGDALTAARFLAQRGAQVTAWIVQPTRPNGLAARHARTLRAMGIACADAGVGLDLAVDLVLDGLLGSGIRLPLREDVAPIIAAMNASNAPIIAVDIPSGLDADTGAGDDRCVRAAATLTLGLPKPGMVGIPAVGRLFIADIGLPVALFGPDQDAVQALYRHGDLLELRPPKLE
jgi:NAD(P)H-hydrate epimerase